MLKELKKWEQIKAEEERKRMEETKNKNIKWFISLENSIPTLTPENVDEKAFEDLDNIKNHINKFVDKGMNLYLWSHNVGNGKTSWAMKIGQAFQYPLDTINQKIFDLDEDLYRENYVTKYGYHKKVYMVNVTKYLIKLKRSFNDTTLQEEVSEMEAKMKNLPLVIFDDIGTKTATDFDRDIIYDIINTRLDKGLSSIYTSNISPDELEEVMGARLQSRIAKASVCIELKGHDRRPFNVPTSLDFDK